MSSADPALPNSNGIRNPICPIPVGFVKGFGGFHSKAKNVFPQFFRRNYQIELVLFARALN